MKYFVAGNDVLAHMDEVADTSCSGADRDARRHALALWLARFCDSRDCDAVLVFDGTEAGEMPPPTTRTGRVTTLVTPYGIPARSLIAGPANQAAADERVYIVSADRRTADAVARSTVRLSAPDTFLTATRRRMGRDAEAPAVEPDEKFSGLAEDEVEFWLDFFDEE
jgi:YacP-like NYN domain-containing protein